MVWSAHSVMRHGGGGWRERAVRSTSCLREAPHAADSRCRVLSNASGARRARGREKENKFSARKGSPGGLSLSVGGREERSLSFAEDREERGSGKSRRKMVFSVFLECLCDVTRGQADSKDTRTPLFSPSPCAMTHRCHQQRAHDALLKGGRNSQQFQAGLVKVFFVPSVMRGRPCQTPRAGGTVCEGAESAGPAGRRRPPPPMIRCVARA